MAVWQVSSWLSYAAPIPRKREYWQFLLREEAFKSSDRPLTCKRNGQRMHMASCQRPRDTKREESTPRNTSAAYCVTQALAGENGIRKPASSLRCDRNLACGIFCVDGSEESFYFPLGAQAQLETIHNDIARGRRPGWQCCAPTRTRKDPGQWTEFENCLIRPRHG